MCESERVKKNRKMKLFNDLSGRRGGRGLVKFDRRVGRASLMTSSFIWSFNFLFLKTHFFVFVLSVAVWILMTVEFLSISQQQNIK